MDIMVFERFRQEVLLHVFSNYNIPEINPPLILGISGCAGEGKSSQCSAVFAELGLDVRSVPMNGFEDMYAGNPAENIQRTYDESVQAKREGRNPVIFIEDFDLALGDFGAQYTVNRQHVCGTLMGLAELARRCPSQRVPIITTGNDFGRLYAPLTRPGRMRLFEWAPTREEKALVLRTMFPKLGDRAMDVIGKCDARCEGLGVPHAPISLYAAARLRLVDDVVLGELRAGFPVFPDVAHRNDLSRSALGALKTADADIILRAMLTEIESWARIASADGKSCKSGDAF